MRQLFVTIITLALALTSNTAARNSRKDSVSDSASDQALRFYARAETMPFDEFLRRLRPGRISPELKARALSVLVKNDLVAPSAQDQVKLAALRPILRYHEREDFIEPKVLRVRQATVAMLAGAAVIITESALKILSAEELQAVVAHELAHEYFWNEIEQAREQRQPLKMRELELRCDGLAIITLARLGLNPACFIAAVEKLTKYNGRAGIVTSSEAYPSLAERREFCCAMIEMVRARGEIAAPAIARR